MGCCGSKAVANIIDFSAEVNLSHFEEISALGSGAFGTVKLVKHLGTGKQYALKYIDKRECILKKAMEYVIEERNMLEYIQCPFVCNLRYAFQNDEALFMALDLKTGGDLRFALEAGTIGGFTPGQIEVEITKPKRPTLAEDVVKFMIAEVCLGVAYLHSKNVVHRDLKPENVMLDDKGHCSLVDFNVATYFDSTPLRAKAGTLPYMAPEVISKDPNGYNETVDWWSVGVITFELLFGKRPFRAPTSEELEVAIVSKDLLIPKEPSISKACIEILRGLLTKSSSKRLGSQETGGNVKIMEHAWFAGYNWTEMEKLEGNPVFVPEANKRNVNPLADLDDLQELVEASRHTKEEIAKFVLDHQIEYQSMKLHYRTYDFSKPRDVSRGEGEGTDLWDKRNDASGVEFEPDQEISMICSHISNISDTSDQVGSKSRKSVQLEHSPFSKSVKGLNRSQTSMTSSRSFDVKRTASSSFLRIPHG
ncbi:UNVERIFIED_CONTAM: hypothetical protein HDU68_000762 [Siphonaria sp. JEL0065]|nr:hypothetical protein HDU68_000762 [Siphonaria sp. JEL0065]